MTPEELNTLRFNMPIMSTIDNSVWYYDCRDYTGNAFKIFKQLNDTDYHEGRWRGRSYIRTFGSQNMWEREGSLTVTEQMMLEDFELVYKIVEPDLELVKKNKYLMSPYSIVKPNFHMIELRLD